MTARRPGARSDCSSLPFGENTQSDQRDNRILFTGRLSPPYFPQWTLQRLSTAVTTTTRVNVSEYFDHMYPYLTGPKYEMSGGTLQAVPVRIFPPGCPSIGFAERAPSCPEQRAVDS